MARTAQLSAGLALGRIAYAAGLAVAPERLARGWLGAEAARPVAQIAIRGLAARDLLLSAGVLATARSQGRRPWLAACVAGDCADVAATLLAGDHLSQRSRRGTIALAGAAAAAGTGLLLSGSIPSGLHAPVPTGVDP